jgi:ubiquinone/menaquinone biosynthesis C-methylase UbiE
MQRADRFDISRVTFHSQVAQRPSQTAAWRMSVSKNLDGLPWKGYEGRDYENFWTGLGKQHLDRVERLIVSHALQGGDAIIEIGAGFGRLGNCYIAKYKKVHMVEPASNLRKIAARTYGEAAHYHEANVYNLPFPNATFDAALMVRVFHHLGSPEVALKEIHRILRPGARLVFNFSNKRNIKRIGQYVTRRAQNPFTHDMEEYATTLIGHHPRYVERLLSELGFEITDQFGVGVADKIVEAMPSMSELLAPSLSTSRFLGRLKIAPAQFIVAVRK